MTSDVFEEQYGDLVRRDFSEYTTAHTLRIALEKRRPPIRVSDAVLKLWLAKTGLPEGAVKVSSSDEPEEQYVVKTEYQGRGTLHLHIAAWSSDFLDHQYLKTCYDTQALMYPFYGILTSRRMMTNSDVILVLDLTYLDAFGLVDAKTWWWHFL